jgi:two-component system sensor histidine kinase TctE
LRPVTANTPEEVEALVAAINSFMGRLQTALDGLRNFTGNASHQLRTPLAVVRTQLALMDRSESPAQSATASDKARSALERAERVLAQLLVLARVDASSGAAVLQPVDMAAIAKEVTAEMVPSALPADIDLGFEGLEEAVVLADAVLLAEVLKNLVANAISYAGAGAMVTVRVLHEAGHAVLEIEDNGPGLSADQRTAALQAQRGATRPLPSLAKGQSSGMGLGLAITAEISALFGADLDLTTGRGGTGLLARVRFPAAAGTVAAPLSA